MAFEFGVFHEFQRRPGQSEAEAFTTAFEQVDAAERWGLDAIWLAEIHMAPERSVCAAPLTIASAIAARTKNIKVGLGVQVLPLCQPLRLAEEAATVDHISRGRLLFGVGRSGFPRAYEAYGISYGESTERFAEVLDVVKRAWTQETFSFTGKYYNYENVCIVPKPYRKPHPPIRIAANREDTFISAGRQGYAIFVGARRGTIDDVLSNLRPYREAWKAAGHPGGLSARSGLCRRHRRAGVLRPGRDADAFFPLSGGTTRGIGKPRWRLRHRAANRGRATATDAELGRGAPHPGDRRHTGDGRRSSCGTAGPTRPRRHSR